MRAAAGRRARRALRVEVGGGGRFNPPLPGGGGISIQAALREPGAPGALWDWAGSPVRGRRWRARRRRAGKRETWGGRERVREKGGGGGGEAGRFKGEFASAVAAPHGRAPRCALRPLGPAPSLNP